MSATTFAGSCAGRGGLRARCRRQCRGGRCRGPAAERALRADRDHRRARVPRRPARRFARVAAGRRRVVGAVRRRDDALRPPCCSASARRSGLHGSGDSGRRSRRAGDRRSIGLRARRRVRGALHRLARAQLRDPPPHRRRLRSARPSRRSDRRSHRRGSRSSLRRARSSWLEAPCERGVGMRHRGRSRDRALKAVGPVGVAGRRLPAHVDRAARHGRARDPGGTRRDRDVRARTLARRRRAARRCRRWARRDRVPVRRSGSSCSSAPSRPRWRGSLRETCEELVRLQVGERVRARGRPRRGRSRASPRSGRRR